MSLQFLQKLNGSNTGHFAKYLTSVESQNDFSISWFPSCGEDFRNLLILNDLFIKSNSKSGKKWRQPDLFIYTDSDPKIFESLFPDEMTEEFTMPMTETENLLLEYADLSGWDIYQDDLLNARVKRFEWLPELEAKSELGLSNKKVAYLLLDIWTEEFGEFEAHLIYCNVENEWFANKLMAENAKISHLTKFKNELHSEGAIGCESVLKNIVTKLRTSYYISDPLNTDSDGEEVTQHFYTYLENNNSEYKLKHLFTIPDRFFGDGEVTIFEVELINGAIEQSTYQNWAKNTSPREQEILCGSGYISDNEKYFIEKYATSNCIDIGCGTGNRTFKEYERKGIDYIGIEQFEHLKEYSHFPTKIQLKDITSDNFLIDGIGNQKFDIAFYFGGVINGFVSTNARLTGWENIEQVAKKYANYILFDTLSHFPWFRDENKENGDVINLLPAAPPQYFYSLKELKTLFAKHQLEIVEKKEEPVYHFRRTHFLLKYVGV